MQRIAGAAPVEQLNTVQVNMNVTFEQVTLPKNEHMGLMGASFLYETNEWLSLGGSAYGALTGQRGGFITLGLAAEARKEITDLIEINSGFFVGAGGGRGGFTLQGGGLMLRYHLGMQINSDELGELGAGLSYVDFPNGNIHSAQPYISYKYPFRALIAPGWLDQIYWMHNPDDNISPARHEFALVYRSYLVPNGVLADDGGAQHPSVRLLGVEWQRYLNEHVFLKIESEGALGGRSNGYMQILFGGGYRFSISRRTALKLSASLGPAGGGNVATGGGLLIDAAVALHHSLGNSLFVEIGGGLVNAPDGDFRAASLAGKIGYRFATPDVRDSTVLLADLADYKPGNLRIRMTQQNYFQAASGWRNHHAGLNVNLLGFQADYFLSRNIYMSGQGIAAYKGQAGGYMTGLVGAGLHFPLFGGPLFLETEALAGAAGGGGLDVSGGFVWQGNAGIGYQLSDAHSLIGMYGYMSAPRGKFRARVLSLTYAYRFSIFTLQ